MVPASDQIAFRPGTPDDGPTLLAVHRRAILEVGVAGYDPATADSWAHGLTAEGYGRCMDDGEWFEVATLGEGGPVVGFCSGRDDEITGLYVDPDRMARGLASRLLDRAQGRIAAAGHVRTWLRASLGAVPFYERRGFAAIGERQVRSRGGVEMRVIEMERAVGALPIPDDSDAPLFQALEQALLRPDVRSRPEALDALLHDAFVEFGRSGRVYTKQEVIETLPHEGPMAGSVEIEGLQARRLAPDVVLVTYASHRRDPDGSKRRHALRSSVWVWREDRWQMTFHQGTAATDQADPT